MLTNSPLGMAVRPIIGPVPLRVKTNSSAVELQILIISSYEPLANLSKNYPGIIFIEAILFKYFYLKKMNY